MLNRLTDTLDFQAQALTLRSERQRLIASNIANADTPGYVAREMNFAQALREATGGSAAAGTSLDDMMRLQRNDQAGLAGHVKQASVNRTFILGGKFDSDPDFCIRYAGLGYSIALPQPGSTCRRCSMARTINCRNWSSGTISGWLILAAASAISQSP